MAEKKDPTTEDYGVVPLGQIIFDTNIRKKNEDDSIDALSESMKTYGQLQQIRVYKKNDNYVVIYGHRRCLAAKKAGLTLVKVVIVPEPESIDKIYMQAIENEQSKSLSPEDRESYIHSLLEMWETFKTISQIIGISSSWARECNGAFIVREKYKDFFSDAGITFTSKELYAMRNATEKEVKETVALAKENPEKKREILKALNKRKKKKMNVGGKTKSKENAPLSLGGIKIAFSINLDENKQTFSIQTKKDVNIDEKLANSLMNVFISYYSEKGYTNTDK